MARERRETAQEEDGRGRRGRRKKGFVAIEDAPGPGLHPRTREVLALVACFACSYVLLALWTFELGTLDGPIPQSGRNLGGVVGHWLAHGLLYVFGAASQLLVGLFFAVAIAVLIGRRVENLTVKILGAVMFTALVAVLFAGPYGEAEAYRLWPYGPGGRFGSHMSPRLRYAFGGSGRILIVVFGALISLLLATGWMLTTLVERAAEACAQFVERVRLRGARAFAFAGGVAIADVKQLVGVGARALRREAKPKDAERDAAAADAEDEDGEGGKARRRRRAAARADSAADQDAEVDVEAGAAEPEVVDESGSEREPEDPEAEEPEAEDPGAEDEQAAASDREAGDGDATPSPAEVAAAKRRRARKMRIAAGRRRPRTKHRPPEQPSLPFAEPYPFPPIELFREPEDDDADTARQLLDANKEAIERRLGSFKIEAEVVAASVGPAVTQYEVALAEGIRVTKICTATRPISPPR
jgi:hypothetical protein